MTGLATGERRYFDSGAYQDTDQFRVVGGGEPFWLIPLGSSGACGVASLEALESTMDLCSVLSATFEEDDLSLLSGLGYPGYEEYVPLDQFMKLAPYLLARLSGDDWAYQTV